MYRILQYTLLFITVALLQILVFNNLHISIYVTPFIYLAFIILLPLETKGHLTLILSAAMGIVMDIFMGTPAINTISTVFLGFSRGTLLRLFVGKESIIEGGIPNIGKIGIWRFVNYSIAAILLHNIVFFALEGFFYAGVWFTILRIAAGVISTMIAVYLCQMLFVSQQSQN